MPARFPVLLAALTLVGPPVGLRAQEHGLDFTYGIWRYDSLATTIGIGYYGHLLGPVGYRLGLTHLSDPAPAPTNHTLTGGELSITLGNEGRGLYLVGTTGLAVREQGQALNALWSGGVGYAVRPFGWPFSLGIEARYRVEDVARKGFWALDPADRRGFEVRGHLAIPLGGRLLGGSGRPATNSPRPATTNEPLKPLKPNEVEDIARHHGASENVAKLTTSIVQTAMAVMGTPYEWGGTTDNGFDCSGLIQYAYGKHGIILPRVSRDQMRFGQHVDKKIDALRPGDILGFAVETGGQITHVGLYVGNGEFIHSASEGVKLSSLSATDPDSHWWWRHWVGARRVVQ